MRDFTLVAIFFSYMRTEAETDVRGKHTSKNSSVWAWVGSRIQCRWTLRVMGSWLQPIHSQPGPTWILIVCSFWLTMKYIIYIYNNSTSNRSNSNSTTRLITHDDDNLYCLLRESSNRPSYPFPCFC